MRSWKTTLMGWLAGGMIIVGGALNARINDPNAPPVTVGTMLPAIAIGILGSFAKDHDVSGRG